MLPKNGTIYIASINKKGVIQSYLEKQWIREANAEKRFNSHIKYHFKMEQSSKTSKVIQLIEWARKNNDENSKLILFAPKPNNGKSAIALNGNALCLILPHPTRDTLVAATEQALKLGLIVEYDGLAAFENAIDGKVMPSKECKLTFILRDADTQQILFKTQEVGEQANIGGMKSTITDAKKRCWSELGVATNFRDGARIYINSNEQGNMGIYVPAFMAAVQFNSINSEGDETAAHLGKNDGWFVCNDGQYIYLKLYRNIKDVKRPEMFDDKDYYQKWDMPTSQTVQTPAIQQPAPTKVELPKVEPLSQIPATTRYTDLAVIRTALINPVLCNIADTNFATKTKDELLASLKTGKIKVLVDKVKSITYFAFYIQNRLVLSPTTEVAANSTVCLFGEIIEVVSDIHINQ
jgi:hypothetical protein